MPHMTETRNIGVATKLPLSDIQLHPRNARVVSVETIKESMAANGVYKPIVVNKGTHTGRPLTCVAGNHSLKAMWQLADENPTDPRWQEVDVWLIDVDEHRETKILVADNATADNGDYDREALAELIGLAGELFGTGYAQEEVDELNATITASNESSAVATHYRCPSCHHEWEKEGW